MTHPAPPSHPRHHATGLRRRSPGGWIAPLLLSGIAMAVAPAAEPAITGVVGSASAGQSLTIMGSGFGSKSPVAPLKFDTFENGSAGDYLLAHDPLWQSYQGDGQGLTYSTTAPHAGALALGRHNTDGENFVTNYFSYSPGSQELFVSYWWKVVPINPGTTVIKMTRLNSSPAAGGGGVYNGAGNTTLGGTYDLGTPGAGPYCAFNDGSSAETPITGDWGTSYFNAPPTATWIKVDSYKKLSTPGLADGALDYRIHTQERINTAASTRAAGNTFLLDTVLLGTMEGAAAPHDYWVYIDDVYIDNTRARVELCDAARWADRTHGEMQPPHTQWTDGQLQVTVNLGSFASGTIRYLYVVNSDGSANAEGYPVLLGGPAPTNHQPVATPQNVTASQDAATAVTLSGSDADGDPLTFSVATAPSHGTLGGSGPSKLYTPEPGFHGSDSFTFTVHDGTVASLAATVSITVSPAGGGGTATATGGGSGGGCGAGAVAGLVAGLGLMLRLRNRRR